MLIMPLPSYSGDIASSPIINIHLKTVLKMCTYTK